jgi:hypothetical protein
LPNEENLREAALAEVQAMVSPAEFRKAKSCIRVEELRNLLSFQVKV